MQAMKWLGAEAPSQRYEAAFYCPSAKLSSSSSTCHLKLGFTGSRNKAFARLHGGGMDAGAASVLVSVRASSPAGSSSSNGSGKVNIGPGFSTRASRNIWEAKAKNGDAHIYISALGGLGLLACALQFPEASLAAVAVRESSFPTVITFAGAEPSNALSLPTWVIHVASVVEWVTAMALVWKYGDTKGKSAWKGLTWGMVPLLGGAMCACTWHFFYNAESLEVLVVLQASLTVVGNFTMWAAAYRIWKSSQEKITVD